MDWEKDWPIARRWKATGKTRGSYTGALERKIYLKFGEEGLRAISEVWQEAADRYFLEGLKTFAIQGAGPAAFAQYFFLAQQVLGYDMELVEAGDRRAVVRYHTCHVFPQPDPVSEKLCREGHFQFEKRAAELLNPKLKVSFAKLKSAGDPYCELVIELKKD